MRLIDLYEKITQLFIKTVFLYTEF